MDVNAPAHSNLGIHGLAKSIGKLAILLLDQRDAR
jgi:hypothetical protein